MNNQSFSPLSAAEMAVIWKQYMNDKAISCMLKQFLCHVDDLEIQKRFKVHCISQQKQ